MIGKSTSDAEAADRVIAVDLGGTKIAVAAVDREGRCGPVLTHPTPAKEGADRVVAAVATAVAQVRDDYPSVVGVGVGTTGVIDSGSGTVVSATDAITDWPGTGVAEELRRSLDLPVVVDNDVNAHAAGEAWLGAGRGASTVLMVVVGTGVGGAVVFDGKPLNGVHYVAGEVGHGPARGAEHLLCGCGRRGHLEAIASGTGVLRHYRSIGGDEAVADTRDVVARAEAGEDVALRAVRDAATALGTSLAGMVMLVDPDVVVVGGGLVEAERVWWEPMETALRAELIDIVAAVPVLPAELGNSAALLGAARNAWNRIGQAVTPELEGAELCTPS